ncbi:MAG TPA: hypothetical protein VKA21_09425 [Candidatus Binatia bacterium]|nr:hypothetical protein [Candidatus Binatia bacterium]
MVNRKTVRGIRVAAAVAIFAAGFLCGSVTQRRAEAQLGDVLKKGAQSGALGPVGDLGTAMIDMQEHVNGLQKNLDTLKKVKAALGG